MVRRLTLNRFEYGTPPRTDDSDLPTMIETAVGEVLLMAEGWFGWDGRPVRREGNTWTPHRRCDGSPTTCSTI